MFPKCRCHDMEERSKHLIIVFKSGVLVGGVCKFGDPLRGLAFQLASILADEITNDKVNLARNRTMYLAVVFLLSILVLGFLKMCSGFLMYYKCGDSCRSHMV